MSYDRIDELTWEAENSEPYEAIPILEEAVRLGDELHEEELSWSLRMELLSACVFGGAPEKALMIFAWLESKSDREPDRFPASRSNGRWLEDTDLLWAYKWIFVNISGFVQISRVQIENTLERMRTKYEEHNVSLRPYWMCRVRTGIDLGNSDESIREALENFRTLPRDVYADCKACETHFMVESLLFLGELDRALLVAEPLINGEESCAEVPHITYPMLTVPTHLAGMHDKARLFHQRGYELCKSNPDFLSGISELMAFRILDGDWSGGAELFEAHVRWAEDTRSTLRRLRFLQSARALAHTAPEGATLKSRSPLGPGTLTMSEWETKLAAEITQITTAFDRRNGNSRVSELDHKQRALCLNDPSR